MKLTIKSANGQTKVVELNKDILLKATKDEQYIFLKGFSGYSLNLKDNQQSMELVFNVDGRSVKVDLKGIVPLLQENIPNSENLTAVVINKNISDKDIDNILANKEFSGGEIIDKLESLISNNPENTSEKLTLISDFQTLVESLNAAAAGPGGEKSNGSTFNSIFSITEDSLNGIAETDRGVNLNETFNRTIEIANTTTAKVDTIVRIITIDPISENGYLNAVESNEPLVITGKTEGIEVGQEVTISLNGKDYTTTVKPDGTFEVTVPVDDVKVLEDATYEVEAKVDDVVAKEDFTVDTTVDIIILDPISEDGYLNAQEVNEPLVITGKTEGIEVGQEVTVSLNGKDYITTVKPDGTFEVTVPVDDVQALEDGEKYEVQAKVEDKAGNETSFSSNVKVDLVTGTLVINEISDDYINAIEYGNDLTISGYTTGIESGQVVTITLNGKEYTGNVASDGSFGITIPASDVSKLEETTYEVNGKVTDKAGNEAVDTEDFTVDLTPPSIELDPIDYVNAQTHGDPFVVTGKVEGVEAGTPVIVELNGEEYPTTVKGDGTFEVTIPADDVTNLVDGEDYEITATVQDKAGNEISDSEEFSVDTTVPTITLDTISTDGYMEW